MGTSSMDWTLEERGARDAGYVCVAGIDEAGRGAWAGPVVAACIVLPFECVPPGVNDSKALTPAQRDLVFDKVVRTARGIGIGVVEPDVIDRINILRATHEAMRMALADLPGGLFPDVALIDGLPVVPFPIDQIAIIKGDSRSASIAAASVVAKVSRDRIMCSLDATYPGYGFASNKGYGAPAHIRGLEQFGICPVHRRSYRPVAAMQSI